MTLDWLAPLIAHLDNGSDAMLVTVARIQGSAPREAGATMLVTASESHLTIGGGHLEWQAIEHARTCLAGESGQPEIVRYNLGARLGQCCGGVVWLLFERIAAGSLADWRWRQVALANGEGLQRRLDSASPASTWTPSARLGNSLAWLSGDAHDWRFVQDARADRMPVYLFGAGHVARALVRQLALLDTTITWIDNRDDAFDDFDCDGLTKITTDTPEAEVGQAPPGTYFLVMTHSHALDFVLCEAIYHRRDFAYFGLIGSSSKRASFERRLVEHGLERTRLTEMTCPIGIPGISGKAPATIALAVAAELCQIRQTRQLLAQAGHPRPSPVHLE